MKKNMSKSQLTELPGTFLTFDTLHSISMNSASRCLRQMPRRCPVLPLSLNIFSYEHAIPLSDSHTFLSSSYCILGVQAYVLTRRLWLGVLANLSTVCSLFFQANTHLRWYPSLRFKWPFPMVYKACFNDSSQDFTSRLSQARLHQSS